jgi:hypothetical protein
MAEVIAEVVSYYTGNSELKVKFTTRVKSAVHMLDLTEKFRTEQETEGPWQEFQERLVLEHFHGYVSYEFFKGANDVILELTISMFTKEGYTEHKVSSEQIAGTILQEVKDYLDLMYIRPSNAYENKAIKDLLVFQSY